MRKRWILGVIGWMLVLGLGNTVAWARWVQEGNNLNLINTHRCDKPCVISDNGTLYAAWQEGGEDSVHAASERYIASESSNIVYKIYVKHWDGTNWIAEGDCLNVNTAVAATHPSLAAHNGIVYVAWSENNQIYVKHWNGSSWIQDGGSLNGNTGAAASNPSLAINNGIPYVAWQENNGLINNIFVKCFNGSNWMNNGSNPNLLDAGSPSLVVYSGTVYLSWSEAVAYKEKNGGLFYQIFVKHWDNGNWVTDGQNLNVGINQNAGNPVLSVDKGNIYVAWEETNNSVIQIYLKYMSGSTWWTTGGSLNSITSTAAENPSVAVCNETIYVAWNEGNQINIKHWDGNTWVADGYSLQSSNPSLTTHNGIIYAAWSEHPQIRLGLNYITNYMLNVKYWSPDRISKIDPDYGVSGKIVHVTVSGSGFEGAPVAKLNYVESPVIASASSSQNSFYSYTYAFDLAGAEPGVYDVQVNANGCQSVMKQAFTILSPISVPLSWKINDLDSPGNLTLTSRCCDLDISDADQDGSQELYVSNQDQVLYKINKYSYGWATKSLSGPTGVTYNCLVSADGNGDQSWEIYGSASNNHVYQFNGSSGSAMDLGAGNTEAAKIYSLTKADADQDGIVEIYAAGDNGTICQFSNSTSSTWTKTEIPSCPASKAYALASGDGDNNGTLNLYSANSDGKIYQYLYTGNSWQVSTVGTGTGEMYAVAVGDGNNDGFKTVYAACHDGNIYQFQWNGSGWAKTTLGSGAGPLYGVAVSDGDNDGENEIYATAHDGCIYQYKQEQWGTINANSVNTPLYAIAVGDADNDHHFEIYALGSNNHVYQFQAVSAAVPTSTAFSGPRTFLKVYHSQINPNHGEQAAIKWIQPKAAPVTITIYNLLGDKVITLVNDRTYPAAQNHRVNWDGRNSRGGVVGSGIYIVHIQAGGYRDRSKIAVIK